MDKKMIAFVLALIFVIQIIPINSITVLAEDVQLNETEGIDRIEVSPITLIEGVNQYRESDEGGEYLRYSYNSEYPDVQITC